MSIYYFGKEKYMKKTGIIILSLMVTILVASCMTFTHEVGIDPGTDTSNLAYIKCDLYKHFITITEIDGTQYWDEFAQLGARSLYINPGIRTIKFRYQRNNGIYISTGVVQFEYAFEAGKKYQAISEMIPGGFTVKIIELE